MEDHRTQVISTEVTLKCLVLGYIGIGKTQLLNRLAGKKFNFHYKSTIALHLEKYIRADGPLNYTFQFWEIDPRQRGSTGVVQNYVSETDMIIFMWDAATNEDRFRQPSLEDINNWLETLDRLRFNFKNIPVLVIMNKTDLSPLKEPIREEAEQIASWLKKRGVSDYESISCSVKDDKDLLPIEQKLLVCAKKTQKSTVIQSEISHLEETQPVVTTPSSPRLGM